MYTVCIRYFWLGNHQKYGHIRCIYTVLANPTYVLSCARVLYQSLAGVNEQTMCCVYNES